MDLGTAVGVVSLGLQVCKGLVGYYQDWEGFEEDIHETYTSINDMSKTFALLSNRLQAAPATNHLTIRAAECLVNCQGGIQRLDKRLKKLHKETPNGFRQKIQAGGLRVVYPFRRSTLLKLKEIVDDLTRQLNLTIQVLLLDNSSETRTATARLESTVSDIEEITTHIHKTTLDTQIHVTETANGVQTLLTKAENEQLEKLLTWLSAPDPSINHSEALEKHESGTGEWLLKCQEYQDWKSGKSPLLWLHGKAGCCKTVMCSIIIQDVLHQLSLQSSCVLAYFYFSFADMRKQSYTSLLLSMVTELSRGCPIHPALSIAYEKSIPNKSTVSVLEGILIALLQRSNTSYLVIDALDECPEGEREQIMQGLRRVQKVTTDARILITSRRETDIEDFMQYWCEIRLALDETCVNADIDIFVKKALATDKKLLKLPVETKNEIEAMFHEKSDGMFRWAALQLHSIRRLKILRPNYISTALRAMPRTLDETYKRILLSIDDEYSVEARTALEWLAFCETPLSVAELAEACSIRSSDKNEAFLEEGGEEAIMGLIGVISSLVLVEDPSVPKMSSNDDWSLSAPHPTKFDSKRHTQRIRLAHFSVKEYLVSKRLQDSELPVAKYALSDRDAHRRLARSCCAYFSYFTEHPEIESWIKEEKTPKPASSGEWGSAREQDFLEELTPPFPLLAYAVRQWYIHQSMAESRMDCYDSGTYLHLKLLDDERSRVSWLRLVDQRARHFQLPLWTNEIYQVNLKPSTWHDGTNALYWASLLGLRQTATALCNSVSHRDLDHVAGKYGTALQSAAFIGDKQIVDMLINSGANVNMEGGIFGTALQAAAVRGHDEIVAKLLEAGAHDGNTPIAIYGTALQAAALKGHDVIVANLPQAGPESVNVQGGSFGTALQAAASGGYETIATMLINHGADVNIQGGSYVTALLAATHGGDEILKIDLLGRQPAVALKTDKRVVEDEKIVAALLQAGADANTQGGRLETALRAAIMRGSERMVTMLIQAGANVNHLPKDSALDTPLVTAAGKGNKRIVELLIQASAQINHDSFKSATRSFPECPEAESIAELLFHSGLNAAGDTQLLAEAVLVGSEKLVKMLLQANANVHGFVVTEAFKPYYTSSNAKYEYGSPLMFAAEYGHESLVQLFLDAGADPNSGHLREWRTLDENRETPLTMAVRFGMEGSFGLQDSSSDRVTRSMAIVKKLMDAGADIHAEDDLALYKALRSGYNSPVGLNVSRRLVHLLLANGADTNVQRHGRIRRNHNMLASAVQTGDAIIVQDLLDHGAKINVPNTTIFGKSILYDASRDGDEDMIRTLLENGADIDHMDVTEAYELLNQCVLRFTGYKKDSTGISMAVMILDALLQNKGPDATFFDNISEEVSEYRSYMTCDSQECRAKVKELVHERREVHRGRQLMHASR